MDNPLRAPWRAALRIVLLGVGTLAALVLLSLLLGARPASAATTAPAAAEQRGLVGNVVEGVGGTVQGVTGEVGKVVGGVTDPVRKAVVPAPAAPAPAPAAPALAAVPAAPAPAAPAPAAPAPSSPAPVASTPAAQPTTTAPAADPATRPVRQVVDQVTSASRPVTDTVANVLRPVTGTVEHVTGACHVTAVVDTVDDVVGSVPVVGTVLGDDTLGTVTGPVTGLVDDTLGSVGTTVGTVPAVVEGVVPSVGGALPGGTDPVVDVPALPVGGGSNPPAGPVPSAPVADVPVRPGTAPAQGTAVSTAPACVGTGDTAGARSGVFGSPDHAVAATPAAPAGPVLAAVDVQDATLGGHALLLPADGDGHGVPFDGTDAGVLGGSASTNSGGAAAVGIVGTTDDIVSLAAGSRGTLSDDAVPASVVGEHDVAPD